jgi:hypothetical protein
MSRMPYFIDYRLIDGSSVVSLTRRPHFTARKYFLLLISARDPRGPRGPKVLGGRVFQLLLTANDVPSSLILTP